MKHVIRIGQVRAAPAKGDLAGNHRLLMGVLAELGGQRPDVVVTPECFLDGYASTLDSVTRENIGEYAIDPAGSPFAREVAGWAAAHAAWVVLGCTRRAAGGACNAALIFDRAGRLAGTYDKLHLQKHDLKYEPGRALPAFDSDFGPFGVMICADRRWPETVRTLALGGARVIFNPTFGMHDERNLRLMQTRSWESEVFIAFTHPAQSLVTGPAGQVVLNETAPDRRWSICDMDLTDANAARAAPMAHLRNRRPELYHP